MATKEELEKQEQDWNGVNKYLADEARGKLKDKSYDKPFDYYKAKTVKELKAIAKGIGIPKYYDLNEDELIKSIMK